MKKALCAALATILAVMVFSGCKGEKKKLTLNVGVNTTLSMKCFVDDEIDSGYDFLKKASKDFEKIYDSAGLSEYIKEGEAASWSLQEWEHILDTLAKKLPKTFIP